VSRERLAAFFRRHCPPGFRAMGAVAIVLCALGFAQMAALAVRDEPHPVFAAALALLLASGGAVLVIFVRRGTASAASFSERSPGGAFATAALVLFACGAVAVLFSTGIFFPARMTLFWVGTLSAARLGEPALPMMLAGTCLVGLGAVATAVLCGALWLLFYAQGRTGASRVTSALLSFAGAVPYVAFALVVRAIFCPPVAFLAAGRWLALRPDDQLAYRSLFGMAPGLFTASIALGLCLGRGLWSFLDQVREAEEKSDSFLAGTLRGQKPWAIVLRQGLWLRRRRDVGALLLGGFAAAVLIDILSNTLIDSFRPPGFPTYPSLGAALFLRGIGADGAPLPLAGDLRVAHLLVVLAAVLLLVAQTFPRSLASIALRSGSLRVGAKLLANGVASSHGLPPRPSLQWVLGTSGSGKSTLLKAWSREMRNAMLVPQDPDDALPAALSGTDVGRFAARASVRGDRVLWDFLGRLDDGRLQRSLFDPFTPVSSFSRGERQRLVVCLALARARRDPDCTLLFDEPTSGQDSSRTRALLDCVRELLPAQFAGAVALFGSVELLDARNATSGDRPRRSERRQSGLRLLRSRLAIGGKPYAISPETVVRGGELFVLHGASGSGKSTLVRAIAGRRPASIEVGYVMQDPGRAFPAEMPVEEVLGALPGSASERDRVRRWFGAPLEEMLARPVCALSEGERQRVVFAGEVLRIERASRHARLRLLLLDEPFGAVDPSAHLRLMNLLLGWLGESEGQSAAVLVSHSPKMDLGLARASGIPVTEWTIDNGEG